MMANKKVLDYLKRYSGRYRLEVLKKGVLNSGYSSSDFYEAVQVLGLDKKSDETGVRKINSSFKAPLVKKSVTFQIIGWLMIVLGLISCLILISIFIYFSINYKDPTMEFYKIFSVSERGQNSLLSPNQFLILSSTPFFYFLFCITCGVGLILNKSWSRKLFWILLGVFILGIIVLYFNPFSVPV